MPKIQKEDVVNVSEHLGVLLTEEQIQWVLDNYDGYEQQDPTGNWTLIVEQMLYDIPGERTKFNLDQKVTSWYRTDFTVIADDKDSAISLASEFVRQGRTSGMPWESIDDTQETMSIVDNDGQSTEELFLGDEVVFQNGTDKSLKDEVVSILNTLKKDAEMALSGEWDCTTREGIETGFNGQITLINEILDKLK